MDRNWTLAIFNIRQQNLFFLCLFHLHLNKCFYMKAEEQASFSLFRCDILFFFFCCYSWIFIFFWWVLSTYSSPSSDLCPPNQKSTHIKPGYTDHFNLFANLLRISHLRTLLNESGLRSPYIWTFFFLFFLFSIYFISWKLITLQHCSGFCHTLTRIGHGSTCVPHPDPSSCLPPHPIPLGLPSAPALSTCLMHPTWAGNLFHHW